MKYLTRLLLICLLPVSVYSQSGTPAGTPSAASSTPTDEFGTRQKSGSTASVHSTTNGLQIGLYTDDQIGFYGADPVPQPLSTASARQALEQLGLIERGGAAPEDTISASEDNTLSDGVDFAVGTTNGTKIGTGTTQKLGFWNVTPVVQPTSASQAALTDSTTGTTTTTLAAGVGVNTVTIPIQLASMTTAAADLITNYTPGYKFKILSVSFATTKLGVGSSASQVLNLEIGTTNLTGGVVTITEAGTDTLGELTAGTSVTAANTGTSSDTISVEVASSGTVFSAGEGVLLIKIQNMDTADADSGIVTLLNAIRTGLVNTGILKGS